MAIEIRSTGEFEKKTMRELVDIYNEHAPRQIQKFRDHETAVRRTLAMVANAQESATKVDTEGTRPAPPASMPKSGPDLGPLSGPPPRSEKRKRPKGIGSGRRRKPFDLPFSGDVKLHREGTKRAQVVQMLSGNGATFQEVCDAIGWEPRTAYEGIKLLHVQLGYGVKEDEKGTIRLIIE